MIPGEGTNALKIETNVSIFAFVSRSDVSDFQNVRNREAGQEVRKSGRLSQDLEQFLRKVYSVCKTIRNVVSYEPDA
jgi:hypothetical protein